MAKLITGIDMAVSTDNIVRIAQAGGSVVVNTSITTDNLVRIAQAIKKAGVGHLTISGNPKSTDNMVRIAKSAPGQITFDLS